MVDPLILKITNELDLAIKYLTEYMSSDGKFRSEYRIVKAVDNLMRCDPTSLGINLSKDSHELNEDDKTYLLLILGEIDSIKKKIRSNLKKGITSGEKILDFSNEIEALKKISSGLKQKTSFRSWKV